MRMISEFIKNEGSSCLSVLFWGMFLAFEYDTIRVFRRVCIHKRVITTCIEDIIYWVVAAVQVFCFVYETDDGTIRGFMIAGMILGAMLYRYAIGVYYVRYVSKVMVFVVKPLKKLIYFIRMSISGCILRGTSKGASLVKKRLRKGSCQDEAGVQKRKGTAG